MALSVMAAVPAGNGQLYVSCVEGLLQSSDLFAGIMTHPGRASPTLARNEIANAFLASPFDALFMIDADIGFVRADVEALISDLNNPSANGHSRHFVCGVIPDRSPGGKVSMGLEYLRDSSGLVSVGWCSVGFSIVRRNALETLVERNMVARYMVDGRLQHDFYPARADGVIFETDCMSFCHNLQDIGVQTWVDKSVRVTHSGPHCYA